jgi:hypothetical protein
VKEIGGVKEERVESERKGKEKSLNYKEVQGEKRR